MSKSSAQESSAEIPPEEQPEQQQQQPEDAATPSTTVFIQSDDPNEIMDANDGFACALWAVFFICCFPLSLCAIPCFIRDKKHRIVAAQARRAERAQQLNSVVYTQPGAAPAPAHLPPQRATDIDLEKGPTSA